MAERASTAASCPHCGASVVVSAAGARTPLDCASCGHSFLPSDAPLAVVGDEMADTEDTGPVLPGRPEPLRELSGPTLRATGGTTDVPLSWTGLAAALATAVFYLAVVRPLADTPFGELLGARGWVPYVISFLSFWAAAMLVMKSVVLSRQQSALGLDLLPRGIGDPITPGNAPAFLSYLRTLPDEQRHSYLVGRIARALEHYAARENAEEVVEQLAAQAQNDENAVESSYSMLRVFIWAVPILGFIGTVLGIGASVAGFSDSVAAAGDLDVMKESIGSVTSGLGIAFDTTLLALVMSLFIMFPTSSLQKAEEDFLAAIDDYCARHLVRRLGEANTTPEVDDDTLERVADRVADKLLAALERRR